MERSRSKRNYYYDNNNNQDYDSETVVRTRPRYNNNNNNHHYGNNNHHGNHHHNNNNRHRGNGRNSSKLHNNNAPPHNLPPPPPPIASPQDNTVTTSYRILCRDLKAGGVIGKSGSIIKSIRQHTGAWINVTELVPGDAERIIEICDTRRRDPDGRIPAFSPAQEALFLIHDRILENDGGGSVGDNGEDDYGNGRVATRLVVSKMHVGCLLGKGGKIIEQMRGETKTQIRVLPRDHNLPRCISMSEEIVQVVGDINNVKNAIAIIAARLRESQHRDRTKFHHHNNNHHGRMHSPERFFPDEEFHPHMNNPGRRSGMDGYGGPLPRLAGPNHRAAGGGGYGSRQSGGSAPMNENAPQAYYVEELVFRILCPAEKLECVVGESEGIVDLLQNEIGVDVRVVDPMGGSNERIIVVSSEEVPTKFYVGPDDELFPAQEALLHIQTRILDLVPDKDNIVTTRLLIPSSDIGCLEGRDGSLSEIRRLTGATIQILPREELPMGASGSDELVQIIGEIKAARNALVDITSRIRSYLYREFFQKDPTPPSISASGSSPAHSHPMTNPSAPNYALKETGGPGMELMRFNEIDRREEAPSSLNRITVPLVTRSTLEVVIPELAVPKLKSKNKLAMISELSGANVTLVEDRPEIIQISGAPDQVERAQSLIQGFILSTQEDGP